MNYKTVSKQGELVNSRTLYEMPGITLNREGHRLSNGEVHEYYTVHVANGVCIVPRTKEGKLIMIWQYRAAWQRASLEFPGGRTDPGEELLNAARRELQEEAGYTAGSWQKLGEARPVRWTSQMVGMFLAEDLEEARTSFDDEEDIETVLVDPKYFWSLVQNGDIIDFTTIVTWQYFQKSLGIKV